MPTWPSTLPAPLRSSYSLNPEPVFIRTDMDGGNARQRRRFTKTRTALQPVWQLTQDELKIFEAWWHWQINDGIAWFQLTLWNGKGLNPYQVRFTKAYKPVSAGGLLFNVSTDIEVFDLQIMTQAELAPYL